MQPDPTFFMADQLVRILTVQAIQVLPWVCVLVPIAYLHAKWSKK